MQCRREIEVALYNQEGGLRDEQVERKTATFLDEIIKRGESKKKEISQS